MDGEDVGLLDAGTEQGGDDGETAEAVGQDSEASLADNTEGSPEEADRQGDVDRPDGRYGTKDFKAHLAKIKEVDPLAAKAFERAYWKVQGVDKLGTTQELTALKEAVELHGGVEGLSQLAETVENYNQLENGFKAGDPKVIDGWASDYPDGFKRLIPAALDKLAQMDGERYAQVGSGVTDKLFSDFGVFQRIAQLGDALSSGKVEDAVTHFNVLTKFLSDMKGLAKGLKDNPYKAREDELDQREKSIAERDQKAFTGGIRSEVNTAVSRSMNQEISKLMRGRKFSSTEQGNRVRSQINDELQRLTRTGDYDKRYATIAAQRDHAKAVKFVLDNANRNMSKAVSTILKDFNLLGTNGARPAARPAARNGAAAPQTVAGRPQIPDVDFTRTDKSTFMGQRRHGTAWLKNGRQAKW